VPFAPDSRTAGYLGPKGSPDPVPLEGDAWEDFCQQVVAGVTGLPGNRVFPRWQLEEPNHPALVLIGLRSVLPQLKRIGSQQ
jgi:hypothetical protein